MKTTLILFTSLSFFAIPAIASAETAVIEATVTRAGTRTPVAALTLDVADDGSRSEAEASSSAGSYEVSVARSKPRAVKGGATLQFRVEINRGRAGRFKLRSARSIKPGVRTVIGSFRQANGEILEVAVTTRP